MVQIGTQLQEEERAHQLELLRANADVFAWTVVYMPRIPPDIIIHKLSIDPKYHHVRQKKRSFIPERQREINEEVDKLLAASFICEVQYPT